jgi:hypothetical protein
MAPGAGPFLDPVGGGRTAFGIGRAASVAVIVRDIPSASALQVTYVPALGPFLTFFDARCDTASVSAEVFDHAGAPVAGQRVSLTASSSLSRDHALSGRQDS